MLVRYLQYTLMPLFLLLVRIRGLWLAREPHCRAIGDAIAERIGVGVATFAGAGHGGDPATAVIGHGLAK